MPPSGLELTFVLSVADRVQLGLDSQAMRAARHAVEAARDRERERAGRAPIGGRVGPVREGADLADGVVGDRVRAAALEPQVEVLARSVVFLRRQLSQLTGNRAPGR